MMKIIEIGLLLILVTVIVSCDSTSSTKDNGELTTRFNSQFNNRITMDEYPEAVGPHEPIQLKWDFSKEGSTKYSYILESDMTLEFESHIFMNESGTQVFDTLGPTKQRQHANGEGKIIITSNGDNTADLFIQNVAVEISMEEEDSEITESDKVIIEPEAIKGMSEDGSFETDTEYADNDLKLFFPLPPKEISVGESVVIPIHITGDANGVPILSKGISTITLEKYVNIDNHVCACLVSKIDIDEAEVTEGAEGEYNTKADGRVVYYFDIENHRFVSVKGAFVADYYLEAPSSPASGYASASMIADRYVEILLDN